ncbi:nicotinate-nucleotide--dimethylbenzimidazole phosphoribosyltransferase [Lutispora sp.]|uniref:nicotinate-nucleotide--dimethylbenzimidazole phosphoribosyltransferase n=1 Tax=Lutispora sp. TaxID=2828727 RepID=UPI000EC15BD9|nr:nicotinate-nucleotide--dimethylbenzimidazole phosphoribosyltransferase [Lutispora sp.]MEA4960691.1 nicotinate-nucleotide--dimethylbenzimidazole phosphoribosyltransferase [Lutispora sp.]HCJ58993.1 nicotinate-nucleotide--dimethylbenzimidazole phosphoribosyltransferase [Clostridiaceae bacterium]
MKDLNEILEGIEGSYEHAKIKAKERLDNLAKPLGSLGQLEEIAIRLSGITGKISNPMTNKQLIIMSADNGVVEEGVSSCPQNITAIQTINFIRGVTGVGVLAKHAGAKLKVVDIGINADIDYPGLYKRKIRKSTWNMAKGPAMTREEGLKAIETGINMVEEAFREGAQVLGTGEMGIGNTSTSSAIIMAFTGCDADEVVGKGSGLTGEGFENKKKIITQALKINNPDKNDPIDVLSKVGGFDIGGMAGCFIGAAYYRLPVLIDGLISAAAALLAYELNPMTADYMFTSHCSAEPGYKTIIDILGLKPMLNLDMRLGEGSGCAIAFNILEAADEVITNMATFEEASIKNDYLIDIR